MIMLVSLPAGKFYVTQIRNISVINLNLHDNDNCALAFRNSICFMSFISFSEQTTKRFVNVTNISIFVTSLQCVLLEIGTDNINIV
jgi:hypothetical protein